MCVIKYDIFELRIFLVMRSSSALLQFHAAQFTNKFKVSCSMRTLFLHSTLDRNAGSQDGLLDHVSTGFSNSVWSDLEWEKTAHADCQPLTIGRSGRINQSKVD
jgi:hypothetical protein